MDQQKLVELLQKAQQMQGENPNMMVEFLEKYGSIITAVSMALLFLWIAKGIYKAIKMRKLKKRIMDLELEVAELKGRVNALATPERAAVQPAPEPHMNVSLRSPEPTQNVSISKEKTW